jgi:beta-glucosidase
VRVDYVKPRAVGFAIVQLNCAPALAPGEDHRIREAAELAARSRAAVVFVGMPPSFESEGGDRASLELPNRQNELVAAVAKANPNTIVVVNVGAPVSMPWLGDVRAVIAALYPGMMGGAAIWNLVFGKTNPSGKLPVTFPVRVEDTPAFINYPGGRTVRYGEGLFVGYRYYDKKLVEPLFPFGHGLSYTEFEYSKLKVPAKAERGEKVRVSLTLRNTGKRQGREVVQVYVRDVESSVQRPDKELKAFKKVELRPGETKTVEFALEERAFAFYDVDGRRWVVEPGKFEILVGSSSRDIRVSKTCEIA